MSNELEFTGERFTPDCMREIRYEHFHRYALVAEWIRGKKVLDAACGEGYGSHLLAARASDVTGVDVSSNAVAHARSRYASDNLRFVESDGTQMPFEDHAFDCIISFETLEHLDDHDGLLTEFRRVLKPDGFLVISSPDKAVYTEKLGNENPFHVKELYKSEFEQLLGGYFPVVRLFGQKLAFHSMIWPLEPVRGAEFLMQRESGQTVAQLQHPGAEPVYLLALCAGRAEYFPTANQALYLFDDEQESVYQHYNHEIRHNLAAGEVLRDLEARLASMQAEADSLKEISPETEASLTQEAKSQSSSAEQSAGQANSQPRSWLSRLFGR